MVYHDLRALCLCVLEILLIELRLLETTALASTVGRNVIFRVPIASSITQCTTAYSRQSHRSSFLAATGPTPHRARSPSSCSCTP